MERKFYRFTNDEDDCIISITEDQKRVFDWFVGIGYYFNLEPLNLEEIIEI